MGAEIWLLVEEAERRLSGIGSLPEYEGVKSRVTEKASRIFHEWQRRVLLDVAPRREVLIDSEPGFRESLEKGDWKWFRKNFGLSKKDLLTAVNMAELLGLTTRASPRLVLADSGKPDGLVWSELVDISGSRLSFGRKMAALLEKLEHPEEMAAEGLQIAEGAMRIEEILARAKPEKKERKSQLERIAERPHPDRFTCSCCFRFVARRPENRRILADHGYTLKNNYRQDACDGSNYPPLQDGPEGLDAMIMGLACAIEKGTDFRGRELPRQAIEDMERELAFKKALRVAIRDEGSFRLGMLAMKREEIEELAERYDEEREKACPQL